jgi:hypothetical protein
VRSIGVVMIWFCLGLGVTELVVLSMEQVVSSARMPQEMMAYTAAHHPMFTRTDLAWQTSYRP